MLQEICDSYLFDSFRGRELQAVRYVTRSSRSEQRRDHAGHRECPHSAATAVRILGEVKADSMPQNGLPNLDAAELQRLATAAYRSRPAL